MSNNNSFLTDNDKQIFYSQKEKPNWKRVVIRKTEPVGADPGQQPPKPLELDKIFSRFIKSYKTFNCHCIQVKEDDGMSWAAEIVRLKAMEEISREASPFSIISMPQFKDKLPLIVDIIGMKTFLRLAVKNEIAKNFHSFHTLSTILAGLIPLIVTVLTGLVSNDLSKEGGIANLLTLKYLIILIVTLAICLLGRYYLQKNQINTRAANINALIEDINNYIKEAQEGNEVIENSLKFEKLIADCAMYFLTVVPKFVIIDNYKKLDFFTRQVIDKYFSLYTSSDNNPHSQKECWVIFERDESDNFSNKKIVPGKKSKTFKDISVFAIKTLTEEEKLKFLKENDIPSENASFSHMRPICTKYEGLKWVRDNLLNYRKDHPNKEFHKLEFLYLLALTSTKERIPFSDEEFYTIFQKGNIRSEILKSYMYNTYPFDSKKSINTLKNNLLDDNRLKDMLEIQKKDKVDKKICVTYETTLIINKDSDYNKDKQDDKFFLDLSLPNEKLGHAFWAIYWYDRLQSKHPNETFWFDELSFHLTNFDFETLRSSYEAKSSVYSIDDILSYTMEAYIYTIGGCLRTAAFKEISQLVECAVSGIRELQGNAISGSKDFDRFKLLSLAERLTTKCWEAYICFKDKNVLKSINALNEIIRSLDPPIVPISDQYDFCRLYFEIVANNVHKDYNDKARYGLLFSGRETLRSIEDHIIISAALTGVAITPLMSFKTTSFFVSVSAKGFVQSNEITRLIKSRIMTPLKTGSSIVDLINLSRSIWAFSFKFSRDLEKSLDVSEMLLASFDNIMETIVYLQKDELHSNRKTIKNEFLLSALLTEMTAVTMASFIICSESIIISLVEKEFTTKANKFIQLTNDLFNTGYLPIADRIDLTLTNTYINGTALLLQTTSAIWNKLGFTEFGNNLNIIGFQLKLIKGKQNIDEMKGLLTNDLPVLINPNVYSKFTVHILIAEVFRFIHFEYSFIYYCEALKAIAGLNISKHLYCELFLTKLTYLGSHPDNIEESEKSLLGDEYFLNDFLPAYIAGIDDDSLESFLNEIFSNKELSADADFHEKLSKLVSERIEGVKEKNKKVLLDGLLKFFTFLKEIGKKDHRITADSLLNDWGQFKEYWYYASLLRHYLVFDPINERITEEGLSLFIERNEPDNMNSYLLLAVNLASREMETKKNNVSPKLISYLRNNINRFEEVNAALTNYYIYIILYNCSEDSYKGYYKNQLVKWDKIMEDEKKLKFKANLSDGNYFGAFHTVIYDLKAILDEELEKYICRNVTQEELHPFIHLNGKAFLSAQFIDRGISLFFDSKYANNSSFNDERNFINELALANIDQLFKFLIDINVSSHFKEIVDRYNNAYKEYTMPDLEN